MLRHGAQCRGAAPGRSVAGRAVTLHRLSTHLAQAYRKDGETCCVLAENLQ